MNRYEVSLHESKGVWYDTDPTKEYFNDRKEVWESFFNLLDINDLGLELVSPVDRHLYRRVPQEDV